MHINVYSIILEKIKPNNYTPHEIMFNATNIEIVNDKMIIDRKYVFLNKYLDLAKDELSNNLIVSFKEKKDMLQYGSNYIKDCLILFASQNKYFVNYSGRKI